MTERLRLLLLSFFAILLTGLLLQDGGVLLLAIPFVVYILSAWLQAPPALDLSVERSVNTTSLVAGEDLLVEVLVRNRGGALPHLSLWTGPALADQGTSPSGLRRLSLQPAGEAQLEFGSRPGRGVHRWGELEVCAADPFGLFEQHLAVPAAGELLVRPAPIELPALPLHPAASLRAAGRIPARAAGSGTDFWGVKAYAPGDPLRRLNWRRAARHPERLFTNEYQREQVADFGLILDARMLTGDEPLEAELFEARVSAAAALAERLLKGGNRVSLLIFGRTLVPVFPGAGRLQHQHIVSTLACAELGGYLSFDRPELFPARLFPSRSQLVVFSDFDVQDSGAYARLRAYSFNVLLISPDPVARSGSDRPSTPLDRLASRAARIERLLQLDRLARTGVEVIDWDCSRPLADSLQSRTPEHGRRRGGRL